jgi:hypothetical protein
MAQQYRVVVECDVVPMQACHILLGTPWQFDKDSKQHGRLNQYSFLHHDKKIVLHPMSPEAIMHDDVAAAQKLNLMTMLKLQTTLLLRTVKNMRRHIATR